jgi:hypothetical protein
MAIATVVSKTSGTRTTADATGPTRTVAIQATTSPATVSTSIVASSLAWSVPFSFSDQTVSGSIGFVVTGAGCSGWATSIVTSPFVYSGAFTGIPIPATNLRLTSVGQPTVISGSGDGVRSVQATRDLSAPQTVLRAETNAGTGRYQQDLGIALTVPGGTVIGSYQSTITIMTSSAP